MVYPPILKQHLFLLQINGLVRYNRFKEKWKNLGMFIYFISIHLFSVICLISHILSTTTRSIRYMPEFYQKLFEDLAFTLFYFETAMFTFNGRKLNSLRCFLETRFSQANPKIVKTCEMLSNLIFYGGGIACACTLSCAIIETYFPVSQEEQDLLRYIYKRKHPERILQTNFWIPFIDDSESWYYEAIFHIEFYQIYLIIVMGTVSMTSIASIIIHLIGQYYILAEFIVKLGRERHYNGTYIYYTNFVRNECIPRHRPYGKKKQKQYEQNFCRQLLKFHQMLLQYQEKMYEYYSPNMFVKVLLNNIMFALCLYQITCKPSSMSKARIYKLIMEFLAVGFQYFLLCSFSDFLDNCNPLLAHAIGKSAWYNCTPRTRRDLCIMIRRVQKPNHLKFYQGVIILNRTYFAQVVKLSYSLVNFMRMKSNI